ncbi:MAG: hypothetical protein OXB86_03125 [Bdellovibrionales bacterium]|nr:hypothetical protein [Bdellovibrionales bacterium]
MFILRLVSFAIRVLSAFILTLVLQIQWDGKSLEHYLVRFGKKTFFMKTLNRVGQDGVKTIRSLTSFGESKKQTARGVANYVEPKIQKIKSRLNLPEHPFKEKDQE